MLLSVSACASAASDDEKVASLLDAFVRHDERKQQECQNKGGESNDDKEERPVGFRTLSALDLSIIVVGLLFCYCPSQLDDSLSLTHVGKPSHYHWSIPF
mmetsp:Transcript_30134/g.63872  ORF Transcript_30134/g.63872 Transcript_30134/m.63872 type:complete len:100 (+) Transcript_30134:253-552(+)